MAVWVGRSLEKDKVQLLFDLRRKKGPAKMLQKLFHLETAIAIQKGNFPELKC